MHKIVHEHFLSINGEVNPLDQGSIQYFIRFQGCNMSCSYCDTPNTQAVPDQDSPFLMDYQEVAQSVVSAHPAIVNFTGGEPLLYQDYIEGMVGTIRRGNPETLFIIKSNGMLTIEHVKKRCERQVPMFGDAAPRTVLFALDYKQEPNNKHLFHPDNFELLTACDTLNFPIMDADEFNHANYVTRMYKGMGGLAQVCFSPIGVTPKMLFSWMKSDTKQEHEVIMNIQTHKQAGLL